MSEPVIKVSGLKNRLGGQWVHTDVNFTVEKGEIFAIIGGSGSGKTTLLRSLLMLLKPTAGEIRIFGKDVLNLDEHEANAVRRRWGMLFQHSALFSAMTVLENVIFPMQELSHLSKKMMLDLARLKVTLVGLPDEAAGKYPAELSGGMQRRAAAARAIAMDPELLFLDEPTSGLDPLGAKHFDHLLLFLRDVLNLTIVIVSHDIESLERVTDRVAFLGQGRVLTVAPMHELMQNKDPMIVDYFSK
ncbi:MAG: ATP-binding cassette domain-containing protein [Gammaproteobacteria bacterium]|nr:ATP-binding cassette domain-containing protein [Gammaproteobacteria bacterium]